MPRKPKPSDLGTGMASRAGKRLKGRKAQLDAMIDAQSLGGSHGGKSGGIKRKKRPGFMKK